MRDSITQSLRRSNTLQRLILINIAVFILINLSKVVLQLFNMDDGFFQEAIRILAVPASLPALLKQPWSIITYAFLHENFLHILFNMLWLFWMGKILVEYLGSKKLLSTYFLGGASGALLYILFFNVFPLFTQSVNSSYALGASGSVLAITVAVATLLPDYTIFLLIIGPVKMKYIALFTILLDLISISGNNAGGHIAHLGGALFGFIYIIQLRKGRDLAKWFHRLADFTEEFFKPRNKMKIVYKKPSVKKSSASPQLNQETIDRILDKISQSGYASLTKEEKELLFKASRNTHG